MADSHNIAIFMKLQPPFYTVGDPPALRWGPGVDVMRANSAIGFPIFLINSQQDQGENGAERSTAKCPLMLWERIRGDHFLGTYLSILILNTIVECQISIPDRMQGSTFAMLFVACLKY